MNDYSIKQIQTVMLEIMLYVDYLCRKNSIIYYIMGGTALGAVRHRGFIPWDDDLDIFMTQENYDKFKNIFAMQKNEKYVLQEFRVGCNPIEFAKVRKNGTTFIEQGFSNNPDIHQGVYIDIMILHKCPKNKIIQFIIFMLSRYVNVQALIERNWVAKSKSHRIIKNIIRILPKQFLTIYCYKLICRYDKKEIDKYQYFYFFTNAGFNQGIFSPEIFLYPVDIDFENKKLLAPTDIHRYLKIRYGDYMKLPPENMRKASLHAAIVDLKKDYKKYIT